MTSTYDGAQMRQDMAAKRIDLLTLISHARYRVSKTTVRAFLNEKRQTARTAGILAAALGEPVARYVRGSVANPGGRNGDAAGLSSERGPSGGEAGKVETPAVREMRQPGVRSAPLGLLGVPAGPVALL